MSSNYFGGTGTIRVSSLIHISKIPAIISEWSALVPLVSHLANRDEDHRMVGELALTGHLRVSLFPRLGYLNGISKLLEGVPDFFDRVNSKSESSYKVWDVNWGSTFTRANGSAVSIVTSYALRKRKKVVDMPKQVLADPGQLPGGTPIGEDVPDAPGQVALRPIFSRYQEIHIVRMYRANVVYAEKSYLARFRIPELIILTYHMLLIGTIIFLCFLGAFGSAAILLIGLFSKLICRLLRTERPAGYLENNENHSACMLSAVHENASTWYLYMGDRGVIDWLLNKTMLATPMATRAHMLYFRLAHVLQLLAMTFVAAQKGIDGICLVALMVMNSTFQHLFHHHITACKWLEAERVALDVHTFRFSGRTPMVGAIHMLSDARDSAWMESLLVPCPRIRVWLEELKCAAETRERLALETKKLSHSDKAWVLLNTQLAIEAARRIRATLGQARAEESLCVDQW